jgi:hypothetical protein
MQPAGLLLPFLAVLILVIPALARGVCRDRFLPGDSIEVHTSRSKMAYG